MWVLVKLHSGDTILRGDYAIGDTSEAQAKNLLDSLNRSNPVPGYLAGCDTYISNPTFETKVYWVARKKAKVWENEFGRVSP